MTNYSIFIFFVALASVSLVYLLGNAIGRHQQRKLWERHMQRANDYRYAVDDLDRWCGHMSPHAKLIATHLKAYGEGLGVNAGTPNEMEACTIDGLRTQLERLKGQP